MTHVLQLFLRYYKYFTIPFVLILLYREKHK